MRFKYSFIKQLQKFAVEYPECAAELNKAIYERKREVRKMARHVESPRRIIRDDTSFYEKYWAPLWCKTKQEAVTWCLDNHGYGYNGIGRLCDLGTFAYSVGGRFIVYLHAGLDI